jgi:methylated-DNA-[protein]-cysteine S-methyltransferase
METQPRIIPVPEGTAQAIRVLMPSPIGPLGVEILGTAVTRLTIEPTGPELSSYMPLHQIDGSDFLDEVFGRLAEYFAGARRKLDLDFDLCVSGTGPFFRRVLKEAAKVPYGRTRTSREIAEACGRYEGCPEVLTALRYNPLPIVIPCHRVIAGAGGLGDYVGGDRRKRWLLEMESQGLDPL